MNGKAMPDQPLSSNDAKEIRAFVRKSRTSLLVILFTDAVGSTGIKDKIGDIRAKRLEDVHKLILLRVLEDYANAQAVRCEGDSYIFVFVKPSDAVLFSLRAQALHRTIRSGDMPAFLEELPEPIGDYGDLRDDLPLLSEFRVGIHMGTIIEEYGLKGPAVEGGIGDIKGLQADTAARIMGLAEGGQILCSVPVFDDARHALKGRNLKDFGEIDWKIHGPYLLKGRENPLEICEVGQRGLASFVRPVGNKKAEPVFSGDEIPTLSVRGEKLPGTDWVMDEMLDKGDFSETWLAVRPDLEQKSLFEIYTKKSGTDRLNSHLDIYTNLKNDAGEPPEGIPKIIDIRREGPPIFVQAEYFGGQNLGGWIESHKLATLSHQLEIAKQIARIVAVVHEKGFALPEMGLSDFLVADAPGKPPKVELERHDAICKSGEKHRDISRLGVVLYQLFSGLDENPVVPDLSKIGDPIVRGTVAACLDEDANKHPTAEEIVRTLDGHEIHRKKLDKTVRLSAMLCIIAVLFFLWVRVFDFFSLDTRIESCVMMIGDIFQKTEFSDRIAIVGIKDETSDKTWRKSHAVLVNKLASAGAGVIVFDMFFESPSEFDTDFADAINQAKTKGTHVVIGIRDFDNDEPKITEKLKKAASGYGIICIGEKLGYGNVAPLMIMKNEYFAVPSLAFEATRWYRHTDSAKTDFKKSDVMGMDGLLNRQIPVAETLRVAQSDKGCPAIRAGNLLFNIFINVSPKEMLRNNQRRFWYEDVTGNFDSETLKRCFSGKIVFVGVQNDRDVFGVSRGLGGEQRYGVELHADATNTILNGRFAHQIDTGWEFLIIALFGALGVIVGNGYVKLSAFQRQLFVFSVFVFCLILPVFSFLKFETLLNPVYYFAAFVLTYKMVAKILDKKSVP